MAFRATCVALLLSSLPIAGCGTAANLARQRPGEGGVSPFGGVRQDVVCLKKAANGEVGFRTHTRAESEQYPRVALALFCAADLPLSFIGDVVTWPYTATYSYINRPVPTPLVTIAQPPVIQSIPAPPMVEPMPIPTPPVVEGPPAVLPPVAP